MSVMVCEQMTAYLDDFSFQNGLLKLNHILLLHRHLLCFLPLQVFCFQWRLSMQFFFPLDGKMHFRYIVLLIFPLRKKKILLRDWAKIFSYIINVYIIRVTVLHWAHCWAGWYHLDECYHRFMKKVKLYPGAPGTCHWAKCAHSVLRSRCGRKCGTACFSSFCTCVLVLKCLCSYHVSGWAQKYVFW